MKNIFFKIALLVLLSISAISCKKFLQKEPSGKVGIQVLFKDVNGAKVALNGAYNRMVNYYRTDFGMYADVASDNLIRTSTTTGTVPLLSQFNFQSVAGEDPLTVGRICINIFEAINDINNIISAIPELKAEFPAQTAQLEYYNAQALVLRALCHFDLSKVYAQPYNYTADASHLGVPIILKTPRPGESISRKSMKETYDQILADINEALPILKRENDSRGATAVDHTIITYQAAIGLLSRIYLYKGDWPQSLASANLVINNNAFVLATSTNYKQVFTSYQAASTTQKIETLFQLTALGLPFTTGTNSSYTNVNFSDTLSGQYNASAKILNLLDDDDIRKTVMFTRPPLGKNAGKRFTNKYGEARVTITTAATIQVIRLSEVYLNRAEAQWNLGNYLAAAEDIKVISQRAHPGRIINIDYNNSAATLYQMIADERNRELCFEGQRLYDIIRRKENLQRGVDCNATVCSLTYPNNKFVLPIPSLELEANKAMQPNP